MSSSTFKVKRFNADARLPSRANAEDAGYDISSIEDVEIPPNGGWKLVSTGIGFTVPPGTYGRIAPRSGLSTKGLMVGAGVVDRGYTAEVKVLLFNHGTQPYKVSKGDRIAQVILEKIEMVDVEEVSELDPSDRGLGGFGSSGK